ncbi:MAG: tetratricopeptide repeat protein [Bacteriovoracia bacterium]
MKDVTIREALNGTIIPAGFELVDLIEVPRTSNRMVQVRTLEEALNSFDDVSSAQETVSYLVRVRPRVNAGVDASDTEPSPWVETMAPSQSEVRQNQEIYKTDGQLNVEYLLKNADVLLHSGEYLLARNVYQSIYQSGEHSAQALYGLGKTHEMEGNLAQAESLYEESIAFHPTLECYERLVQVLLKREKDQYAAEVIDRALRMKSVPDPTRFELHKLAGNCWVRVGKREPAEQHYKAALGVNPAADEIQSNLGTLYLNCGDMLNAKRAYQDAASANPANDRAWVGVGCCFITEGKKREALDAFVKALEADIRNSTAIYYLVKCAYELKVYQPAERLVRDYIQVSPVNANLLYSLAGMQYHLGLMDDATATVQQLLGMRPDHQGARALQSLLT